MTQVEMGSWHGVYPWQPQAAAGPVKAAAGTADGRRN